MIRFSARADRSPGQGKLIMITTQHQDHLVEFAVFGEFTLADYKEFEELVNFKVKFSGRGEPAGRPARDGGLHARHGLGGDQAFRDSTAGDFGASR
jgi:hypothetical protein